MNTSYQVNEIFDSIQGEGVLFSGRLSTFIRLQGCTVGCPWCDSGPLADEKELRTTNGLTKNTWGKGGTRMEAKEIASMIHHRHVIITGGEPTMYNLDALIVEIASLPGLHDIQLETSGQNALKGHSRPDCITWSPKQNLNWWASEDIFLNASEIKFVVDEYLTKEVIEEFLKKLQVPFWEDRTLLEAIVFMPEGSPPTQISVERTVNLMEDLKSNDFGSIMRFGDRLQYRIGVR